MELLSVCAAHEINDHLKIKPGMLTGYWVSTKTADRRIWTGFARSEILRWWLGQGGALVDIPAVRFAERSHVSGLLIWDDMPAGCVIRGITVEEKGMPYIKVVTRASTPEERTRFEHDRMPVLEPPLFRGDLLPASSGELPKPQQAEWF